MTLSSLSNGGLAGVHTLPKKLAPTFVDINDVIPGTSGFDSDDGFPRFRIRPAKCEGQLLFYGPPGAAVYNAYCAVNQGTEESPVLVWIPVLMYKGLKNKSTGQVQVQ